MRCAILRGIFFGRTALLVKTAAKAISTSVSLPKKTIRKFIRYYLSEVNYALAERKTVRIDGFGTFSVDRTEERVEEDKESGKHVLKPKSLNVRFTGTSENR